MATTVGDSDVHLSLEVAEAAAPAELSFVEYNESGLPGADPAVLENFRILIDLSDTTNYKHDATGALQLLHVSAILGRTSAAATWEMFMGVVLAVTGVDVTVAYLEGGSINADGTDPTARVVEDRSFELAPLDLRVEAGDLVNGVAFEHTAETVINSASDIKTSLPGSPTAKPQVGDLIVRVRKTMGAGTLRARYAIRYKGVE